MKKEKLNPWISFADVMTGLMVIFLFIAISYINEQNKFVKDYTLTKENIYNELDTSFSDLFKDWDVKIDRDLSIQIKDASACFSAQAYYEEVQLKSEFKSFLNQFIPRFIDIVLKEEYRNRISEIRIEGHTGIQSIRSAQNAEYYMQMTQLSQKRSNEVLRFILNHTHYRGLEDEMKDRLRFWLTSNGLSFGKAIDRDGNYTFQSKNDIDNVHSLRVEFRIVTTSEQVIEEMATKFRS